MHRILCFFLAFLLAAPNSAWAWSECGHHLIALVAFQLLKPEERSKVVAILEKHPRYAADFVPPANLPNEDEVLHWRVGRAGYWPDVIRRSSRDRPTWHYEIGPALVLGDPATLKVPKRPGPLPEDATLDTQTLHLSQALALCTKTLADHTRSDADRAVAFCWVAHLVGDAHQPCHAGSLFMEKVFTAEDGDRGANRILVKQGDNMHALWDQLMGNEFELRGVRRRFVEMTTEEELVAKGKAAVAVENGLDPQTWLAESRAASVASVYSPEVLTALKLVERGLIPEPQPIDLPEAYLKNAGRIAQFRATEAAHRLAETWRRAL